MSDLTITISTGPSVELALSAPQPRTITVYGGIGPQGPAGDDGAQGEDGAQGPAGADGNTVLNGSGAPSSGTGTNGDFYIDTQADAIYGPKTAGAWGSPTSLVGPTGATGATGVGVGDRRFELAGNLAYCGQAEQGSAEGDAVWTIVRLTLSTAGAVTATGTATDVTWTGRAGHTYS